MEHSVNTHNGTVTMRNPATGNHRTVKITTQKATDKFCPGERILSLLNGSDNETDYQGFAFLKNDGRVIVWKRYRSGTPGQPSAHERLALMIAYPDHYENLGVEYMFSTTCRRCNRKLTTPESIESGIGPICAGR